MDDFFKIGDNVFWCDEIDLPNQSAFLPYTIGPRSQIWVNNNSCDDNNVNMNKRMIEFMQRNWPGKIETQESESGRSYRRKMSERLRRENEKQGYLALRSILPHGTKNDKNSIMQMATRRIRELNAYKEELERRNHELEVKLSAMGIGNMSSTKIEFKVRNPTSEVDYVVEVLKCLNSLGSKIRSIQSRFSDQELVAVMDIETKTSDAEIRKAVYETLEDVGKKLPFHFPEGRTNRELEGGYHDRTQ